MGAMKMFNPDCSGCLSARRAGYSACVMHQRQGGYSQPGYGSSLLNDLVEMEEIAIVADAVEDIVDDGGW
jgi:hypothetical protein